MTEYEPISGKKLFKPLIDKDCIVMAANTRYIPGAARGILQAAKDTRSPILCEIARSESDLKGGYTGYTPAKYAEKIKQTANDVGIDKWVMHADHISVKNNERETIEGTKELVKSQIKSGFTSFAIDASHIFNFEGKTVKEELQGNLDATIEIGNFISKEMEKKGIESYGLEVEVGEVGRKDEKGFILTSPEQAVTFISELNEAGIEPDLLATANGSTHGNIYDERGVKIEQVSIDIPRTKNIAKALRELGSHVRVAQHGITGTPLHLIATQFPRGDVIKGNVGTFWQNIVWDVLKVYEIELYEKIESWVLEEYAGKGKSNEEIFGKNSKYAFRQFFDEMHSIDNKAVKAIESQAYASALMFYKAFNSIGKADLI
ncbi:MAG: fructose-bisphosphate aldolase [Candidatus Altiarchaeales archaeon ex4484_96]|nr:MAG: fructose-bisphosphate aldolase [Candidatus Altiarchaeales archaeon ex4484_96]